MTTITPTRPDIWAPEWQEELDDDDLEFVDPDAIPLEFPSED